jgi:hypothetical protein
MHKHDDTNKKSQCGCFHEQLQATILVDRVMMGDLIFQIQCEQWWLRRSRPLLAPSGVTIKCVVDYDPIRDVPGDQLVSNQHELILP